jgi:hypothetical protein
MRFHQLLRSLARMPLFTGITVLTLALGIGANTAIFSVIEGVLLKPLPYPRSDELVTIDHAAPGVNLPSAGAAPFQYFTYREEGRVFQDVGLWNTGTVSITGRAEPEEVPTLWVTDGVLPMLGVQPMLGRLFSKADDTPATPETVVLTAAYWRSKFGSDDAVVGKSLMVDSKPREIIGVLPDTFRFLDRRVSLVVPYRFDRSKVFLGNFSFTAIGRLKPGTTVAQANAEVARLVPISLTKFPPFSGGNVKMFEEARITPRVMTLKDDLVGDVQTVLWVLMGTMPWSCSSPAPMSPTCSWFVPSRGSRSWRFAQRSGQGPAASRVKCCSRVSAWPCSAAPSAWGSPSAGCACWWPWPRATFRAWPTSVSMCRCCCSRSWCRWRPGCCSGRFPSSSTRVAASLSRSAAAGLPPRAGIGIAPATSWSSRRLRWRSCCSSARG